MIKTFTSIENYTDRKASISFKLQLVWNCLGLIFRSNKKFGEFLISVLAPNFWFLMLIYLSVLVFTYNYYFVIDYSIVFAIGVILFGAFVASLYTSKIGKNNIGYLLLYPVYSLLKLFLHIPVVSSVFDKITNKPKEDKEETTVDVCVTDGRNNLQCKLDLISESGLSFDEVRELINNKE